MTTADQRKSGNRANLHSSPGGRSATTTAEPLDSSYRTGYREETIASADGRVLTRTLRGSHFWITFWIHRSRGEATSVRTLAIRLPTGAPQRMESHLLQYHHATPSQTSFKTMRRFTSASFTSEPRPANMQRFAQARARCLSGVSSSRSTQTLKREAATYKAPVILNKKGVNIMNDPIYNKGVGFTAAERERLEIRGLLPPISSTLGQQAKRIKARLDDVTSDIGKYLMLNSLQDRNETLFYKVLLDNLAELAPIIYTPTVGKVCQGYGYLYRRPRGMYFSVHDRGEMSQMVYNWPEKQVDVVVVTDGSRILGLGDLGANGMGIPIGKGSLYVAAAGIDPAKVLPIMLDAGTNNEALLGDEFYMGLKHHRVTGESYTSLVDELIFALRNRWPNVLIQFEDFSNANAYPLLHHYRHNILCFNDDIQGTGAVALGGIYSALRIQGKGPETIKDQKVVCLGAGTAGLGVTFALLNGMKKNGLSHEEACKNFWLVDNNGLLSSNRVNLASGQVPFARSDMEEGTSLLEVVKKVKPTILLGLSGVGGLFTEEIIREMAKHVEDPIIFPLSNPTDRAECSAENAFKWTNGKAIFASGSPFKPVEIDGKMYYPSQGNNMFIFPGIGLGAVATQARRVSTTMFATAAEVLSSCVSEETLARRQVYPDVNHIRDVTVKVATAVADLAIQQKVAKRGPPEGKDLAEWIREEMYTPTYRPYVLEEDVI
ncbi:putative NAD-dependent malic enzyme [Planoprotostelium fungivorum]|uniref:Malic enzyme n=1 Tax=Planoprotostelium fungivorum TaxID=1890364 RepID=A0A2P6MZE3_9EUKA|nr:putative NAD-dependent malic enzyme [Planoprotostelium fungivorum]